MNSTAKQIAKNRVQVLFQQAESVYKATPQLAQRYIATARQISMAARIRLPAEYKRKTCKNCNAFLVPGWSSRVRIKPQRATHIVVTCLGCGYQTRIPVKAEKEKVKLEQNNQQDETSR